MFNRKFSSNIRLRKRMITSLIILLVVFLSAGYAAFTTNLGINGTLNVSKYKEKIYWALQDNDNDSTNETLVLSSEEVNGIEQGNFTADTIFSSSSRVPWTATSAYSSISNKSYNVTTVTVEKEISPASTAYWFTGVGYNATSFTAGLQNINTSQVTDMSDMFNSTGRNATTWNIGGLSGWDTSKVANMKGMFYSAGYNSTTFNLNLSEWNTSQVTIMSNMFSYVGYNSTTFDLNLSGWDTSKVTNMNSMFNNAGNSATTWNIGGLSGWNTSQVTNMS
ncbi:MAG: BspA family leucine-rich repeat surface protein, partial [Bacilli bacterium]|nr:BspA family leucine-rich repeat surface protein [Bacilli bacterium]